MTRVEAALARFRKAQAHWDDERARFAQALDAAQAGGATVRELAALTGLTASRVSQIIRGARGEADGRGGPPR
jgi:predicted transcriptional regulator